MALSERTRARIQVAVGTAGPFAIALLLGSPLPQLAALNDPRPDVVIGAITLLIAMALTWTLLIWAVLVLLALGAATLPGAAGAAGRRVFTSVTPAALRATLTATVGLSLAVGLSACGGTAAAQSLTSPASTAVAAGSLTPTVSAQFSDSPNMAEASATPTADDDDLAAATVPVVRGERSTHLAPALDLDWPTTLGTTGTADSATGAPSGDDHGTEPLRRTESIAKEPAAPEVAPHAVADPPRSEPRDHTGNLAPTDAPSADHTHVVVAGDSLWSIAKADLPDGASDAEIDAHWRLWYAANRTVIGPNPGLIHPGQVLHAPAQH